MTTHQVQAAVAPKHTCFIRRDESKGYILDRWKDDSVPAGLKGKDSDVVNLLSQVPQSLAVHGLAPALYPADCPKWTVLVEKGERVTSAGRDAYNFTLYWFPAGSAVRRGFAAVLRWLLFMCLVAAVGVAVWQYRTYETRSVAMSSETAKLQKQVEELTAEVTEAKKEAAANLTDAGKRSESAEALLRAWRVVKEQEWVVAFEDLQFEAKLSVACNDAHGEHVGMLSINKGKATSVQHITLIQYKNMCEFIRAMRRYAEATK